MAHGHVCALSGNAWASPVRARAPTIPPQKIAASSRRSWVGSIEGSRDALRVRAACNDGSDHLDEGALAYARWPVCAASWTMRSHRRPDAHWRDVVADGT